MENRESKALEQSNSEAIERKKGDTRNKTQGPNQRHLRRQHLYKVSELFLTGLPQYMIAQELGVTRQQIGYDLQILNRYWLQSAVQNFDKLKSQELAKLQELERTFREGYERSCKKKKKVVREKKFDPVSGYGFREVETTESDAGDPKFLFGELSCIAKRSEILGFNKPVEVNVDHSVRFVLPMIEDPDELEPGRDAEEIPLNLVDDESDKVEIDFGGDGE